MNNKEVYCFAAMGCVKFINEKAPTCNRGVIRGSWRRAKDWMLMSVIILLHKKERNAFMEWDV
jgi:hypothetical protein